MRLTFVSRLLIFVILAAGVGYGAYRVYQGKKSGPAVGGPQGLLGVCSLLQAAGVTVLILFAGSTAGLIVYVLIYGAAFGASSPLSASVRASHFGRRAFGSITAVQGVMALLCAALGPLAAGA